jgi:DNA-binding MarR family transcriptional regulator
MPTTPERPDDDTARAMDALRRLVRALRTSARDAERAHAVSAAQLFVLRELAAAPGLSFGDLARRTHTRQSSVSEVVARLVEAGLVARTTATDDGRRRELTLTARGRAIAESAAATMPERLVQSLDALPATTRGALADGLQRWVDAAGLADVAPAMFFERPAPRRRGSHAE